MAESRVNKCRLAVDTMGSDSGPVEFIRGLSYVRETFGFDCEWILCGDGPLLKDLLKAHKPRIDPSNIHIHPTTQVIDMDDKPIQALRKKKDSSMVQAIELLRDRKVDAVVSCGNTGALMAGGALRIRPLQGVDRPALGIVIPTGKKPCVLIDVGANPESTVLNLVHNAVLGSNYAKAALKCERPSVGLLTIGTEESKGNSLISETHKSLQNIDNHVINYTGLVEGFQIFDGDVNVIVCDGFIGNIVLKSSEAVFSLVGRTIKEELLKNPKRILGAALVKSAFRDMKARLSPDRYAGAPLLGIQGNILKSHGSSNYIAIANALRIARETVMSKMIDSIGADINKANDLI